MFLENGNKKSNFKLKSKIYSFISKGIATQWKRLAHNLNFDDKTIDEINGDKFVDCCEDSRQNVFKRSKSKKKIRVT